MTCKGGGKESRRNGGNVAAGLAGKDGVGEERRKDASREGARVFFMERRMSMKGLAETSRTVSPEGTGSAVTFFRSVPSSAKNEKGAPEETGLPAAFRKQTGSDCGARALRTHRHRRCRNRPGRGRARKLKGGGIVEMASVYGHETVHGDVALHGMLESCRKAEKRAFPAAGGVEQTDE